MFRIGRKAALTAMAAMFSTALLGGVALAAFAPVQPATQVVAGAEANKGRGDNLKAIIDKERGGPIAAVILFTDGGGNAGGDPKLAMTAAADA